jgi:outer membrane protein assembly factor BamB
MKHILYFTRHLLFGLLAFVVAAASANAMTDSLPGLVGAFPSHPKGAGPGKLNMLHLPDDSVHVANFGQAGTPSGNSFYVAVDFRNRRVYVPSVAGTTYVTDLATGKPLSHFKSIAGGRVARLSPDNSTVFILSSKALAAYSTSDSALRYQIPVGGNAMAFSENGRQLYVGGNMDKTITDIDASSGHIKRHISIGHSGDIAWANGKLFSADMRNGVMSVYNPQTGHIDRLKTNEVDRHFSYKKIPAAKAGFMQLAVSADQMTVYAAGFSGHILRFSTAKPAYLGEIKVSTGKAVPEKLSGLAMLLNADGDKAITTIENRHESVIVDLRNGHVLKRLPKIASNRWVQVR